MADRSLPGAPGGWLRPLALWSALFAGLTLLVQLRLLAPLDEAGLRLVVAFRPPGLTDAMNWIFRLGFVQVDAALALLWAGWLLLRTRRERTRTEPNKDIQDIQDEIPCGDKEVRASGHSRKPSTTPPASPIPYILYILVRFRPRLLLPLLAPLLLFAVIGLQAGLRLVVDQPAPGKTYELWRPFAAQPVEAVLDRSDAAARAAFTAATSAPAAPGAAAPERGSFPSGHSARILFLALLAAASLPRKQARLVTRRWPLIAPDSPLLRIGLVALAVLVGYSAMYFGYHWPSDVLGGYLLALALYPLAARLRRPLTH